MDNQFLALVAVAIGFAAGGTVVWLLTRGKIEAAAQRARSEAAVQLATINERVRGLEVEREQLNGAHEALQKQADEWREALDTARDERAQLSERAARVPALEAQVDGLSNQLKQSDERRSALEAEAPRIPALEKKLGETEQLLTLAQQQAADLREASGRIDAELKAERSTLATLREELEAEKSQRQQAEAQVSKLTTDMAALKTLLEAERSQSEEKLALLNEAKEALSNQFKTLANEILEEKAKRFTEQNQTNIGQLLEPLKTKLNEFQGKVEEVYVQEGKDRTALAEQVRQLMELNQSLSQDAKNLTRALKGSSKAQGNWGELILERVLEASGLRKGEEYDVQESHTREDGSRAQPDVVVHLPEERHLVVDAKVSLTAYEEFASSEDEGDCQSATKRHLDSVRAHIRGLSDKNYQALYGLKSLDFVLMFVPIEPAFMLAVTHDRELFMDAWKKNVLLVSPSTLLFVVRTVAHLWRQEAQNRNAQDIAKRGAELYDKLVGFVEDLESLGNRLKQAQKDYDAAHGKLTSGRGNVIRQAEMLKQLGVKPTKALPTTLTEAAADDEPLPALT